MKHGFLHNEARGVCYLSVPSFDDTGLCRTCFSTRLGGVSKPPLDSMNLGFGRGDVRENVLLNYDILGSAAGFDARRTVAFCQVHGRDICVADESFAAEAFSPLKRKFDGIITNTVGLPISTYHADCIPVFLLDPINRAVGLCHAGWRGTALKIPAYAILKMREVFASSPKDILAAIGPGIGACCFETHADVPEAVAASFKSAAGDYITSLPNGKFSVDLPGLNACALLEAGVPEENITLADECTCCRHDLFWSHRHTKGVRGSMMATIVLI